MMIDNRIGNKKEGQNEKKKNDDLLSFFCTADASSCMRQQW